MFGSSRRKVDYLPSSSKKGRTGDDLLADLAEERNRREEERVLRQTAIRLQCIVRAARVTKRAREQERAGFDQRVAACIQSPTQPEAERLARAFAFFYEPGVDSQRLVLLAAVFRDQRLSGPLPLRLLPALCAALPSEAARTATSNAFAAVVKLVSVCTDVAPRSDRAGELLAILTRGWKLPNDFHQLLGMALSRLKEGPLRTALLAIALRPFHVRLDNAPPAGFVACWSRRLPPTINSLLHVLLLLATLCRPLSTCLQRMFFRCCVSASLAISYRSGSSWWGKVRPPSFWRSRFHLFRPKPCVGGIARVNN
jgi:hypothetical protein